MLALSARAGALAVRIGPRLPMAAGPLLAGMALLLMSRVVDGAGYVEAVLPAAVVFGLGLALTVAPLTATVLAAADERHAGVASGVNNAVARAAGLVAVAVLPVVAGIGSDEFGDPAAFSDGFQVAVVIAAGLCLLGAALAWTLIRNDVLEAEGAGDEGGEERHPHHCAVGAPPLRPGRPARRAA
ncbi:hypothetical protein BH18ACT1_BH18ACT1_08320 [soil metagenome]